MIPFSDIKDFEKIAVLQEVMLNSKLPPTKYKKVQHILGIELKEEMVKGNVYFLPDGKIADFLVQVGINDSEKQRNLKMYRNYIRKDLFDLL
jgi:hypothetical protein